MRAFRMTSMPTCLLLALAGATAPLPVHGWQAEAPADRSGTGAPARHHRPAPTRVDVAEGVHVFRTEPYDPVGLDGNAVVVVGADGVLVFDTNGTPAAAAAVLKEIRRLTDQPVRWVVNSHWHWDHWYGTEVYRRAFPDVEVIAHERTRALMAGPALEFNRPGLEEQLPGFVANLERRVAEAEAAASPPESLPRLRAMLAESRFFLEQKTAAEPVLPDRTFTDSLELDLGGRTVRILNFGRAVTPGDALLWLPEERILATGDLLIDPVTYALSVYPTEWLRAMERIDALDAAVLIPGHGAPLPDEAHLHATTDALRALVRLGAEAKARGLDPDSARAGILADMTDVAVRITGGDPETDEAFRSLLVDWFLHRLWDGLDAPLDDSIAPIPQH